MLATQILYRQTFYGRRMMVDDKNSTTEHQHIPTHNVAWSASNQITYRNYLDSHNMLINVFVGMS